MKKIISVIATVFLFLFSAHAQYGYDSRVQFGFDMGAGFANQWGNAYEAYGKKGILGFRFGFFLDINFSEHTFVETGLTFNRKGCRINGHQWLEDGGPLKIFDNEKATVNLFYVELPALIGFRVPIEYEVAWKFVVGPYFGVGVAGERKYWFKNRANDGRPTLISSFSEDYDSRFKRFDLGFVAETGIEIRRISLMIAYEFGMFNNYHNDVYHILDARNNCIMGILGFRY